MPENSPSVEQIIRNYLINLPVFPPGDPRIKWLHERIQELYTAFLPAAQAMGIPEHEQGKILERIQKTLWIFANAGSLKQDGPACLQLDRPAALEKLKFPRPEEALALLSRLEITAEYQTGQSWSTNGKIKASEAVRLRSDLAPALRELAIQSAASSPKEKVCYERFLRANPQARVAGEKPALDFPADSPAILANLPAGAAQAWQALTYFLAGFEGYRSCVEFRSIHHGLWSVNYESKRGGRDLCGLTVHNGTMTTRIILYRAGHFYVKENLERFGEVVASAFRSAHYYEEFQHQWLFIPVNSLEDIAGIQKLLTLIPALLKEK